MDREGQKRVSFYLDTDIKRDFHALCVKRGVTMSQWMRDFVTLAVNHYRGNYPDGTPGRGLTQEE